ncbi:hypothetical protein [Actinoplanes couchii]|uniref:hypothetical protein n=1 Tax=Actinoplanes couchii TaxID=403638 RepID=UPI00194520AC|nr:hypothetical protein [Actinoplanes couchii]MDR6319668.1 hypothetical protein [Actinoplanes couchii]
MTGDVMFGWSPWRHWAAATATGFLAAVAAWTAMSLLLWEPGGRLVANAVFVTVYTIGFATFSLLFARARPAWLRFGDDWIDLAAEGRDAAVVPYPAVTGARVRWVWPVAMLDVTVAAADESQVLRLHRGGRRPLRKYKADQLRFSMPIAGLTASPADIRAELHRRGLGEQRSG